MRGVFITATGTGCGKTFVCRGLARALTDRGRRIAALKPLETGVGPAGPLDAIAIAAAARDPALAHDERFVRLEAATSPLAAARRTGLATPRVSELAEGIRDRAARCDLVLVEGAGGVLVPITEDATIAELAVALGLPLVLVGRDALGTLSHVLTALESAARRGLDVHAIVLTRGPWSEGDPSCADNAALLGAWAPCPVWTMPATDDDDDALAAAVAPLVELLRLAPS